MTFKPSDNLSERYSNYKNSAKAYFNTNLEELSTDEYSINIYINGKLQDTVAVESKETDNYILNIDRNEWIEDEDPLIRENEKIVSISNLIIKVYKMFAKVLMVLSVVSYIFIFIRSIINVRTDKNYLLFELWMIITGVALSIAALCFGLTVFTDWLGFDDNYAAGAYPLLQIFQFMCIYLAGKEIIILSRKRAKKFEKVNE